MKQLRQMKNDPRKRFFNKKYELEIDELKGV